MVCFCYCVSTFLQHLSGQKLRKYVFFLGELLRFEKIWFIDKALLSLKSTFLAIFNMLILLTAMFLKKQNVFGALNSICNLPKFFLLLVFEEFDRSLMFFKKQNVFGALNSNATCQNFSDNLFLRSLIGVWCSWRNRMFSEHWIPYATWQNFSYNLFLKSLMRR